MKFIGVTVYTVGHCSVTAVSSSIGVETTRTFAVSNQEADEASIAVFTINDDFSTRCRSYDGAPS